MGGGIWRPEPRALKKIRTAIARGGKHWDKTRAMLRRGPACGMIGESLKRPPPGFQVDHPFIEDIKRMDSIVSVPFADGRVSSAGLLGVLARGFRATAPFVSFLTEAIGLRF